MHGGAACWCCTQAIVTAVFWIARFGATAGGGDGGAALVGIRDRLNKFWVNTSNTTTNPDSRVAPWDARHLQIPRAAGSQRVT